MSDTPRTDGILKDLYEEAHGHKSHQVMAIEFRQLERELNEAEKRLDDCLIERDKAANKFAKHIDDFETKSKRKDALIRQMLEACEDHCKASCEDLIKAARKELGG